MATINSIKEKPDAAARARGEKNVFMIHDEKACPILTTVV